MQPIYLDHNATTPLAPEAFDAMVPFLRDQFGNPSSSHAYGRRARDAVENARAQVARLIGAAPSEIVFSGCGTEANNLAILGSVRARDDGRKQLVTSVIEHPAVLAPLHALTGFTVTQVRVDRAGLVEESHWRASIGPSTALVSIVHANNEVGSIQPIRAIADHAHRHGALVHSDAAQSAGKISVDVNGLGADLLTLVAHKFYGPKGVGALYIRQGVKVLPLVVGAGHERGLRAGTENVAGIVGMGVASEIALKRLTEDAARFEHLRAFFIARLREKIPDLVVNGPERDHLPNTLHVSFPRVNGSALLAATPEIAASTGSACHGDDDKSAVLSAMGVPPGEARGAVRLTLGRMTTEADLARAAGLLHRAHASLDRAA